MRYTDVKHEFIGRVESQKLEHQAKPEKSDGRRDFIQSSNLEGKDGAILEGNNLKIRTRTRSNS